MKRMKLIGVVLIVLVLIGLTACSQKSVDTQSAGNGSSSNPSSSATATTDVQALILEKLQNHHSIDRVLSAQHTREEWNATLDRMIGYGAKISEEEKKVIIEYLLSR